MSRDTRIGSIYDVGICNEDTIKILKIDNLVDRCGPANRSGQEKEARRYSSKRIDMGDWSSVKSSCDGGMHRQTGYVTTVTSQASSVVAESDSFIIMRICIRIISSRQQRKELFEYVQV